MSLAYLMDVHIPAALTSALRMRRVEVKTAIEEGLRELSDEDLLNHANEQGLVVVTGDYDFLTIATDRQRKTEPFAGVVYLHPARTSFSQAVEDLEILAKLFDVSEMTGRIEYIPF